MGTRSLLRGGIVAGPFYVAVGLLQMAIRDGFDIRRHALSLLSNGPLGWIQVANFVISGLLVIAFAVGLRRALAQGIGARWAPRLIGVYGASLIAAAVFVADPALGFPPGTPDGPPAVITTGGILHFVAGGVGFFSLIAACFILARRFAALGESGWMLFSAATGTLFLAAFMGIASGAGTPTVNLAFALAIVLVWTWLAALAAKVMTDA